MITRNAWWLVGAAVLAACGPAGTMTGKVTVEGGSAAGIAVIVYGPQSAATITADDGSFSVGSLPDGKYVVKATVQGADVEEQSAATAIVQGKASPEPVLNFKLSTAKVTGRVVFADGAGAQDLTVTAVGPETRGARTGADGSYSFENLKTGAYLVSVEAPDTKEGRVSVGVNASGAVMAGELRLTPVGRVGGSVSFNGAAVGNVAVMVTGTSLAATTDATGRFTLEGVPTGPQAILARVGSAPFFRSATAMITIVRGANPDVMLTLTDDPPPTGTVTGNVTFRGPRTPRDITVTAPGTGVMANPAANGTWSLTLPVGTWDIVASAPAHPSLTLGRVTVNAGQVQSLPGRELSWWRPIWSSSGTISSGPNTLATAGLLDTHSWSLVTFNDQVDHLALLNAQTFDFRILAIGVGPGAQVRLSRNAKYAGWAIAGTVYVYQISDGTITMHTDLQQPVTQFEFSTDEATLFVVRNGPFLQRIPLANPSMATRYPATGSATAILNQSVDRWFVRETTDVMLVTPTAALAQVFTQVSSFSLSPGAWALTNCAANCQLRVLATTATSAVQDTTVTAPLGSLSPFNTGTLQSPADYPCFTQGANAFCVRASDGTHTPLVAVPQTFRLNEAGDRVLFTYLQGATYNLREESFPPQPGTSSIVTNTVNWSTAWISPTRAVAIEISGNPRAMHLIKAGVATTDSDVSNRPFTISGPLVVFPQATGTTWKFVLGDGAAKSLGVQTTLNVQGQAVRPLGTGPMPGSVTKFAAISFDNTQTIVIDENGAGTLRTTPFGYILSGSALRSGAAEAVLLARSGGSPTFLVMNTMALLEPLDANVSVGGAAGSYNLLVYLATTADRRTITAGSFGP